MARARQGHSVSLLHYRCKQETDGLVLNATMPREANSEFKFWVGTCLLE